MLSEFTEKFKQGIFDGASFDEASKDVVKREDNESSTGAIDLKSETYTSHTPDLSSALFIKLIRSDTKRSEIIEVHFSNISSAKHVPHLNI